MSIKSTDRTFDDPSPLLWETYRNESLIHEILRHFWSSLFPGHLLCRPCEAPPWWKPDIVSCDKVSYAIAEVKPAICTDELTRQKAIEQIFRYGRQFSEFNPTIPYRLFVIGPWPSSRFVDIQVLEGRQIGFMNLQTIGRYLIERHGAPV